MWRRHRASYVFVPTPLDASLKLLRIRCSGEILSQDLLQGTEHLSGSEGSQGPIAVSEGLSRSCTSCPSLRH